MSRKPHPVHHQVSHTADRNKLQRFRVEGLARRGRVLYVHVIGRPGQWRIYGSAGFRMDVQAHTVSDVLRIAGRKLPFRPIVVRSEESSTDENDKPDSVS